MKQDPIGEGFWNVTTSILSYEECKRTSQLSTYAHADQSACTKVGFNYGTKSDVGNPVVSMSNKLIGITTSFGKSFGQPDIITLVAPFSNWIQSLIDTETFFHDLD